MRNLTFNSYRVNSLNPFHPCNAGRTPEGRLDLINTPLQRGGVRVAELFNRFNGFPCVCLAVRNVLGRALQCNAPTLLTLPCIPLVLCLLTAPGSLPAAASRQMPVISKWARFEQSFRSRVAYSNPLQDATLTVLFTSPIGEIHQLYGFWDGGKTWRVRFSPNLPGQWTFKTTCSDTANSGLHNQTGEFICTAGTGRTRFQQHGPVRVALDHRHFEHADGTPFFWLADTAWAGARLAQPQDWRLYADVRASQNFTVAQWAVAPGPDTSQQQAFTGFTDRIGINPDFFQRLDAKLDTLSRVGILSAIVPLSEMVSQDDGAATLPDDQAALLVRYVVARYGAEPVAWLLAVEGDSRAKGAGRWKRIGQDVFAYQEHAPVVLYLGETAKLLEEFRDQTWVDAFGYPSLTDVTDDALKLTLTGPFANEWKQEPARPIIPFAPYENGIGAQSRKRFSADDVRHAIYWSCLLTVPAGVSYGGYGLLNWDSTIEPKAGEPLPEGLPLWHMALFMPAAKQVKQLATFANSIEFWRLRPEPKFVANQPGNLSPRRFIAAAGAQAKDLSVVYVPEDRTLEILLDALPPSPNVTWLNPRSGENSPAVAVVAARTCQFPTPDPGDWLLVMKAGK